MTDNTTWAVCVALVAVCFGTVTIVHHNEREYHAQRDCMKAGGNWETREHSNAIGCRFPPKAATK